MKADFVLTSESVTQGHPDKLCDQISDAIVDRFLEHDPLSRIRAECAIATGVVFIAARFASTAQVDIPDVARRVIRQVGYEQGEFDATRCTIMTSLSEHPLNPLHRPEELRRDLIESVITPVFAEEAVRPDAHTRIFVNPEGTLVGGGPAVHAGLTGRKNAVDTYGEYSRNSGDALSGKDPLRIDRVGAYAARHAAKNIVAGRLASECEVQLSYSIGLSRPVSIQVETF